MKKIFDCVFFDWESFFPASFSWNLVCAFAAVFSEKSPILGAKVAKALLAHDITMIAQ